MRATLAWVDIETTGLEPENDSILALGVILTTEDLVELERAEWYLSPPEDLSRMPDNVREMHARSGLLERCRERGRALDDVRDEAVALVDAATKNGAPRYLAGSSVHFDRSFLRVRMPTLVSRFHYRLVDVSTLKVLAKLWFDEEREGKRAAHTPLADLEASIAELRHWRERFFR